MDKQYFIGIDISKATFDAALCQTERAGSSSPTSSSTTQAAGFWQAALLA